MFGNTYSHSHTGVFDDSDRNDLILGGEDALPAAARLAGASRHNISVDLTGGIGSYLACRDTKGTKGRFPGKKSYNRGGRAYAGKTKPLKSVTSNQMHAAVFPNMRVPIYMRKHKGKKNHSGYEALGGSGRGLAINSQGEDVPVMSVQCPMPGGTSFTVQIDPVQKSIWGPISRIEASGHAKDLVKQLRQAVKAAKKSKAKNKEKGKADEESEVENEEASKPAKSSKDKEFIGVAKPCDNATAEGVTLETASVADTEATADSVVNPGRRGFIRAPPATPGEAVFLRSPTSAAAMSMPTIPTLHYIAEVQLVEYFRFLHAKDPEAFEHETREIKQGLIDAKIKRGGLSFLLREEYTVELASREGAEIAEKWAKGQARCREFPGLRSRRNSLNSQPSTGSLKMRGGEIEEILTMPAPTGTFVHDIHPLSLPVTNPAPHPSPVSFAAEEPEKNEPVPPLDLQAPAPDYEPLAAEPDCKEKDKSTTKKHGKPKSSIKEIKKALSRLNIAENVTKVTTYGTVRHQSSVKREAGDHGEKRTVTTWIEITEVYDVPKPQKLAVVDIAAAIEQEDEGHGGITDSEWESDDSDSGSDGDPGEKEIARKKKTKAKAKKFPDTVFGSASSASSDSSDSQSDSASDHDPVDGASDAVYHDPNENSAESLLRSLVYLGEEISDENLTRLSTDYSAILAGLGGEGMLHGGGMDGSQGIDW